MRTAGIDLAAEAARTATAVVAWGDSGAAVESITVGADDDALLAVVEGTDKTGIDCPLGWPDGFVDLVVAHRGGALEPPSSSDRAWRRPLTLRVTDIEVHARTGLTPLSVAADRIAHAALRLVAVLATLESRGVDCARDGSGRIAEVYPAAALKVWGLPHRGLKRTAGAAARGELVDLLRTRAPWLDLGPFEEVCRDSDDALDAVLCALVARACVAGATSQPSDTAVARREGWIHVPQTRLEELPAQRPS